MVLLNSEQHQKNFFAPAFNLPSVDGQNYSLDQFQDKEILVVMFICAHCPYVVAIEDRMIQLAKEYTPAGVQFVGICSNDATDYPEDAPTALNKRWKEKEYNFPYLVDESQEVAKAYGVVCTPEFYVFDQERKLAYHGQLDDSWKDPEKVTKRDLANALDTLMSGGRPDPDQRPSMGCSIKWKKGV